MAPSSLTPPLDVLRGTSVDPDRDDVDLGRVYKVRSHASFVHREYIEDLSI